MYERYIKRILDMAIAVLVMPLFVLLYFVISILIKFDDNGPVLYKSERIGKNEVRFPMYKFRSMKVDAPNWLNPDGSTYNSTIDPRVTKVGGFIRRTSIDEIPQIINVIKGDMSIVGPRASLFSALDTYKDDEINKMRVRPGITGYVQAYYRNNLSNRQKRLKDAWYATNVTFWLDARIFFRTFLTVLKREGLHTNEVSIADEWER